MKIVLIYLIIGCLLSIADVMLLPCFDDKVVEFFDNLRGGWLYLVLALKIIIAPVTFFAGMVIGIVRVIKGGS